MRAATEAIETPDAIPLELAQLLSPYGKSRRLSLRVERLPERARLSRGRNNGDRSWSLMRDELDELYYLPPKGMNAAHTLAVRIINLDSDNGTTLAVVELPVSPADVMSGLSRVMVPEATNGESSELLRLRSELAQINAALSVRERELAVAQLEVDNAWAEESQQVLAAELSAARTAWQAEADRRLAQAALEAAAKLEASRASWHAEQQEHLTQAEEQAQKRIEQARERWQKDTDATLSQIEKTRKAAETARLAQAEARWREQSSQAIAEATTRVERAEAALARAQAVRESADDAELRRLRDALAAMQDALRDRERDLVDAQSTADLARERLQQESAAAQAKAEKSWKADEAARLSHAEARWREQSARSLADATARCERAEAALARAQVQRDLSNDSEYRRLRDELAAMQAALSGRDRELADAQAATDRARELWRQETDTALSKAEQKWAAAATSQFAQAEAQWRKHSARALAEATGRFERAEAALAEARTVRDSGDTAEARQLRNQLAELKAVLGEREQSESRLKVEHAKGLKQTVEAELSAARAVWEADLNTHVQQQIGSARDLWQNELEETLLKAAKNWKAEEAARLEKAERRWREQSAPTLAGATAESEHTEIAQPSAREPGETAEIRRLRRELEMAQTSLTDHEAKLAQVRADSKRARERWKAQAEATLRKADETWEADEAYRLKLARAQWEREAQIAHADAAAAEKELEERQSNHLVRDIALAASLAAAGVFFLYPTLAPVVMEGWAAISPAAPEIAPRIESPRLQPLLVQQPPLPRDIVNVRALNVHTAPSVEAAVVGTLARGTEVTPVEQRGSWERVRTESQTGKPLQEGWVYGASLKDATAR